jgi:hypothetical protein
MEGFYGKIKSTIFLAAQERFLAISAIFNPTLSSGGSDWGWGDVPLVSGSH